MGLLVSGLRFGPDIGWVQISKVTKMAFLIAGGYFERVPDILHYRDFYILQVL